MVVLRKYRVVNYKRFRSFVMISAILAVLMISVFIYNITAFSVNSNLFIEIPVRDGDTIWNIARQYGTSDSIRHDVYTIMELNNIEDGMIYPGQVIIVPSL
ncbi:MAG: LysM peptidoglycan-binding domain-containing protein [Dethiosulfatibacter sp.]|nr:LysM peptidoglycan-binding domain-containing protein [Dethiosulfatibacter sp.]